MQTGHGAEVALNKHPIPVNQTKDRSMTTSTDHKRAATAGPVVPATVFRPRTAGPADAPALIRHLQRLGNGDRYNRFFSGMSDDGIRRYVDGFDWSRMVATCVYSEEDLVGVAELGWEVRGAPRRAELALSVDAGFRRSGLATWLVSEVFRTGRQAGVEQVYASWVGGNDAVGRIMRSHGASIWLNGTHWRGDLSLPGSVDVPATSVGETSRPSILSRV
jgi:GNAT superfamily N-acetyltransferase